LEDAINEVRWNSSADSVVIHEYVRSIIKSFIEKSYLAGKEERTKDWGEIEGRITEFYDRNRNGKHDKNQLRRWKSFIRNLLNK
jgi:hypothetical protein